ncbi:MAG: ABC transporter ATP-binding protein [Proteobacteria bacterium]|nr:ABC transporter ATP-binding protein [Pseudomonadota bacterium]
MLRVSNLRKHFGKVMAVDDVSFEADDGRVTGLLGPNGAGKSTTLRMIAGVIRPDAGAATIDGRDVATDTQRAVSALGTLPFNSGLYPRLTGRENIAYFGRLHGLPAPMLAERVEQLVNDLGLEEVADRPAKGYSQGEAMKVAVARALVHRPPLLLADEPTGNLDHRTAASVFDLMLELNRELGTSLVLVTHDTELAQRMDRVWALEEGKLIEADLKA